jgi:short-subunit dehydrogenase
MEIKGSKILITGANRGIGKAVAKRFAEDGAQLYLSVRKKDPVLVEELKKAGAESVEIIESDLSSREGVQNLIDKVLPLKIDILFNNAGLLTGGLLEKQPLDDILSMLQVNINALIHLTHGLLPGMLQRGRGKIINHSSVSGVMHLPCASTYAASKSAVLAFTNSLRQELKGTPVTTLVLITPGVKTRMFDQIEPLYGQNIEVPKDTITPDRYAEMIREAVVEDLPLLSPTGATGLGVALARHLPQLFDFAVSFKFKRN